MNQNVVELKYALISWMCSEDGASHFDRKLCKEQKENQQMYDILTCMYTKVVSKSKMIYQLINHTE